MVDLTNLSKLTVVQHIRVIEKIGRISIDGEVDGHSAAVVFWAKEVPQSAMKSQEAYLRYLEKRLRENYYANNPATELTEEAPGGSQE